MTGHHISDEYLNAFVDNQLDSSERVEVFNSIRHNVTLRDRVCEISALKEMMQFAYSTPPVSNKQSFSRRLRRPSIFQALAASVFLLIGGISGWVAHSHKQVDGYQEFVKFIQQTRGVENASDIRKVIVHVSDSSALKLKAALDETENLLEVYRIRHQPIQVELVANKKGLDIFRANTSQYEKRITQMYEKYPNLKMFACGNTIGKLRNRGENTDLVPHVSVTPSAAEQIHKRLEQGWSYTRI